jgi:hypothetical protein
MKRSFKEVVFLTLTAICIPLTIPGAEPVDVATLRYHFAPDTTNAYSLQIESQGESGREAIEGVYLVTTKGVTGNVATLTFKGRLNSKMIPNQPPMMMGYRGPGSPMTLSSYTMRPQVEGMEIIVDDQGAVVRDSGDTPLPAPLGQIMTSLFEKFPAAGTNAWDSRTEVNIADDPLVQGPAQTFLNSPYGGMNFGYYPGRPGLGILAAQLDTKLRATALTNDSVAFHKTLTLESRMRTGSEPRVSATGDGDFVFNQKTGVPESIELRCKTSVVTENVSRRSTVTLRWKFLQGAERETALNPPPPPPNPNEIEMAETNVAALTEKLKSDESYTREDAVRRLASSKISAPSPALMTMMIGFIDEPNESINNSALTFVANHATEGQVMLLVKSLQTSDQNVRTAIIKALGRLKDKRAAEPLADVLAMGPLDQLQYNSGRNSDAADALTRIGVAAEPAVSGLLKERSNATRWQACGILKRIGTAKSLPALKELSLSPSKELSAAASDAYRAIEAREKK